MVRRRRFLPRLENPNHLLGTMRRKDAVADVRYFLFMVDRLPEIMIRRHTY